MYYEHVSLHDHYTYMHGLSTLRHKLAMVCDMAHEPPLECHVHADMPAHDDDDKRHTNRVNSVFLGLCHEQRRQKLCSDEQLDAVGPAGGRPL
jgi:hypothetical protein